MLFALRNTLMNLRMIRDLDWPLFLKTFLVNDATEGQEDMSFYRRIHVDLDRDTRQEQRQQRLVWTRTNQ